MDSQLASPCNNSPLTKSIPKSFGKKGDDNCLLHQMDFLVVITIGASVSCIICLNFATPSESVYFTSIELDI